jgi:uncharacterized protein (TIGR04255 family)
MSLARPISTANAIEAAAFVLMFDREFEDQEVEALLSLEQSLKDVLPNFLRLNSVTLNVTDNAPTEQMQKMSGVLMQNFQKNGKQDWILRTSENRIIVNCLAYDSWVNVWPRVRRMLLQAAQCVDSETNWVVSAALQVTDKFVYDEKPSHYSISDVFNPDSEFLTPRVKNLGAMWHVFQGWFEDNPSKYDEDNKILHVAKLSSAYINEKLVATIDHTLQSNFSKPLGVSNFIGLENAESGSEFMNMLFKHLHDKNSELLRNILIKEQLDAIGLTQ